MLKLSGLCNNILVKDIQAVELGGRSYCWICRNSSMGGLFIKIDMDMEAFSFIPKFRKSDQKRKKQIEEYLHIYSLNSTQVVKTLAKIVIPSFIDEIKIPGYLVGKVIYFQELILGKEPKTFLNNPTLFQKHCVKYHPPQTIEKMSEAVSNFHVFSQKNNEVILNIEPFFQLLTLDYALLQKKLLSVSIRIEGEFLTKSLQQLNISYFKQARELFLEIDPFINMNNNENHLTNNLLFIKNKFIKHIFNKYEIKTFDINFFDKSLYEITNFISEADLLLGRKIIFLESICNAILQKNLIEKLCNILNELKEKIPEILKLPEVITYNDIHPLNFLFSQNTSNMYLVDFDRAGKNKRICDIGYTLITNNPDENVIYSIMRGYGKNGNNIQRNELRLIYDLYSLVYLTSFVREIHNLKLKNIETIKHIFRPDKYYDKINNFLILSKNNRLLDILDKIIEQDLDALDLASDKRLKQPKTNIQILLRERESFLPKYKEI